MPILAAFMVPHPPMIVPQVGRGSEKQVERTTKAYEQVADEIAALKPETIVITSPHSILYSDWFHISPGSGASGSFRNFMAPQVRFTEKYDTELVKELCRITKDAGFPAGTQGEREKELDHGTMVPLWFIRQKYTEFQLVRIGLSGLPLADHYRLGMMLREAVERTGRRVVLVASGDLSHKLQEYGPYGFAPEGPQYDARIMDVCSRAAFGELFDFEETFCDKAAECGHRSFVIMAGALDGKSVKAEQLSHEDVTGVGYGICTFYPGEEDGTRHFLDQYLGKQEAALKTQRSRLSGMELYRRVIKRLRKIRRIQAAYDKAKHAGEDLSPFAARPALALRATPSGTAGLHREGTRRIINNQRLSRAEERRVSVQYLANQKPPSYLQSVFSI